jgi:uncharacterized DUF497 family protein
MGIMDDLAKCTGFQWDEGNFLKNWEKHGVRPGECEQVFFNRPLLVTHDEGHSRVESRFFVLGQTDAGRRLFLVFTIRAKLIRIISTRGMSRKERKVYDQA